MNLYYAAALLIAAAFSAAVALAAWQRRAAPGAGGLMFYLIAQAVWAGTYALRWLVADPAAQLFWLDATYFGVACNVTFMLICILDLTGRAHLLTRRNLALLAVVPLLTVLLLWTDAWHGLFFGGQHSTSAILSGGPWFWFFVLYSYAQIVVLIVLLIQAFLRAASLYRLQIGSLLFATALPVIGNLLSLAGFSPFPNLDLTPFIFTVSGLIYGYALFGLRLLDVVPVARHKIVDEMSDGVIVLDASRRVVDLNPAVRRLIGVSSAVIGQPLAADLRARLQLDRAGESAGSYLVEWSISENPPGDIEVQVSPLLDKRQNISGYLLILRDITLRKQAEKEKGLVDFRLRTLSAAIEQSPVTTVITDLAGYIVFVNPKFSESTGYTAEEALGKNPRILKTELKSGADYKELWETILAGNNWHGVFHNKRKNGELYWESAVISPVKDENGVITHFLAVKEDISERKRLQEELEHQAAVDELTGISNRRNFLKLSQAELKRVVRLNRTLAIVVIDIDYFKHINDDYGHAAGDLALQTFTKICLENIRAIDLFARIGGDEFALLLPELTRDQAYQVAERIRAAVESQPVELNGRVVRLTISTGFTNLADETDTLDKLFSQADQALYHAKKEGRNTVVCFGDL
jgi:diguanylate cyclase (GGDEF)-like protein/PAS domain S-box-containing protein